MSNMDQKYEALFTPWKIGNVEIKNRIVLCPTGGTSLFGWFELTGCHFDKEAANHFLKRAQNNVGLIIPGIAPIRDTFWGKWLWQNEKMFEDLKVYMDEIHKTGAKLFIQLTAGMGRSWAITELIAPLHKNKITRALIKPVIDTNHELASPSPQPNRWAHDITCPQMTVEQIHEIIEAFAKTAKLCMEAGVDGVEVHAVHEGYLLDQFAIEYFNKRDDQYGGSFENRYRFAAEVVKAIKTECGSDYPVSLRYSVESKMKDFCYGAMPGEDYVEVGRNLEESEKAAKYLQDCGYDMLNADNGTYDSWYWAHPPMYMPENCNLESVAHIKKFVDIPVVCAGRMDAEVGAKAVAAGLIDGVGVARQFLVDPEWVTKLIEDRVDEIKPCICCHNACFNFSKSEGHPNTQDLKDTMGLARCALNPQTMQSKKYQIKPARRKKKVVIVGGGIGGMEAAIVCAKRGHHVTLYEKSDKLGGVFIAAAAPSFKEKDRALLAWYNKEIRSYPNIDIHLNCEVKNVRKLKFDRLIIATGSTPKLIDINGKHRYIEAIDYLLGKKPIIVEAADDLIVTKGVPLANTSYLRDFFKTNKVPVHLETSVTQIVDRGVMVKHKDGKYETILCDSVILSIGYKPAPHHTYRRNIVNPHWISVIGDANQVGNLRTVIWNAWDVATKI